MLIISIYLFIVGAVFASFLQVVGVRVPQNMSIVTPRSHCFSCKHTLSWYELIPIFSYFFLKGKCKNCHARITITSPLFETLLGMLFVYGFYLYGLDVDYIVYLLFLCIGFTLTISDIYYMIVPTRFVIILLGISCYHAYTTLSWLDSLYGFAFAFIAMSLILLLSKGKGMGGGDVQLFLVLGIAFGQQWILLFFLSCLIGILYGGIYWAIKKDRMFPFVPSIMISMMLVYLYGNDIVSWYASYTQGGGF